MKHLTAVLVLAAAAPLSAQTGQQPSRDPVQSFMQAFDSDRDGAVSMDEFKTPQVRALEQQFEYMDKNGDGVVDKGEIEAFADEMRERMEQMQQQQGSEYSR